MAKMIAFDQDAQEAMRRGVSKLARAVKVTLGPRGRNVIIEKSFGSPTVTKDGVTVAREIELSEKFEDMGARMVREVASKTSDVAGDGTTTATVMAEAIYKEGLKAVVAGVSPLEMKRGMDKAVEDITEQTSRNGCRLPYQEGLLRLVQLPPMATAKSVASWLMQWSRSEKTVLSLSKKAKAFTQTSKLSKVCSSIVVTCLRTSQRTRKAWNA